MAERKITKPTYAIKDVSQITGLKAYVLRFWETEFDELHPAKSRGGTREYTVEDIKLIFLIKRLLYEEKYTIDGARQRIEALKKNGQQMDLSFERMRREDAIFEIKKGLQDILTLFEPSAQRANQSGRSSAEMKTKSTMKSSNSSARPSARRAHVNNEVPLFPEKIIST